MKEKLQKLMTSEGLKPSQLAEILGVNPAGISHILAGRNKPSYDFIYKLLRHFPQVNPDWLLLDSGGMYRDASQLMAVTGDEINGVESNNLFSSDFSAPIPSTQRSASPTRSSAGRNIKSDRDQEFLASSSGIANLTEQDVERIVVFYADKTFKTYTPK